MGGLFVATVWVLSGCLGASSPLDPGAPPTRAPDGAVIATVGDGQVTDLDFAEAASRRPAAAEGLDLDARRNVLEELITDEILFQEATRRELYKDPKVRKIMVSLLIREEVFDRIRNEEIPESELRSYYEAHQDDFTVPAKVQVRRIFMAVPEGEDPAPAKKTMEGLRAQIRKDPAKFGELAERHSEDPFKRRGGDLGLLTREGKQGVPTGVVDKAFALRAGQLSEVFEAGGGLNLVLTVSRRDRLERSFDQMKGSVMRRMKNDRFQEMTEQYTAEVRSRYGVDIDEMVLRNTAVQVQAAPPNVDAKELLEVTSPRAGAGNAAAATDATKGPPK
ncbi:MAG: peptidyl-prolyl cis-trans isomerase [Myxococcales bacterium]|nr:peptidyl-prolyl cis-trans isomerase [Myxococcales bacterium]